jgi:hypothetical protein
MAPRSTRIFPAILEKWARMLKRSLAVVLLFLGASHTASALDQRCGGAFDWLLCVNPGLSYSETSTQLPSPSQAAGSQANSDNPATQKPSAPAGTRVPASQRKPRAPLSLDYRVINHTSKPGTNPRTSSPATKGPEGRARTMSKDEKEELYRAFLAWQRRQVINEMRGPINN